MLLAVAVFLELDTRTGLPFDGIDTGITLLMCDRSIFLNAATVLIRSGSEGFTCFHTRLMPSTMTLSLPEPVRIDQDPNRPANLTLG